LSRIGIDHSESVAMVSLLTEKKTEIRSVFVSFEVLSIAVASCGALGHVPPDFQLFNF